MRDSAFVAGLNNTIIQLVYLTNPSVAEGGSPGNYFQGTVFTPFLHVISLVDAFVLLGSKNSLGNLGLQNPQANLCCFRIGLALR